MSQDIKKLSDIVEKMPFLPVLAQMALSKVKRYSAFILVILCHAPEDIPNQWSCAVACAFYVEDSLS